MKPLNLFIILVFLSSCTITSNVIKEPYSKIEVYFCPQDECLQKILNLIDVSQDIKCAFYDLDLDELIQKLKEKNAKIVIEDSNALDDFDTGYSSALMHNKFCVFDNQTVFSGSMNPTVRGNYYNNNNIVIIKSKMLAQNYLDEFYELKKGMYGKGEKIQNPVVYLGSTKIENYFCPEDNCKLQVINALKKANHSIYFMTFSFTDTDIGNLIWNKNYLGLDVKGIFEKKQISDYSRYNDLKDFSIIDFNKYTFHHKVFIIDNKTVITGSFNPSKNANERNDENILIIHDEEVAKKFIDEFNYQYYYENSLPKITFEVIINKIFYDAKGSDKEKEFVEVKNIGLNDINLDYYFISDNKSNMKLNGILKINQTTKFTPKFSLKNSNGKLFLKKNHKIIDYIYYEGIWKLEAKEDQLLLRKDTNIDESSWIIKNI